MLERLKEILAPRYVPSDPYDRDARVIIRTMTERNSGKAVGVELMLKQEQSGLLDWKDILGLIEVLQRLKGREPEADALTKLAAPVRSLHYGSLVGETVFFEKRVCVRRALKDNRAAIQITGGTHEATACTLQDNELKGLIEGLTDALRRDQPNAMKALTTASGPETQEDPQ